MRRSAPSPPPAGAATPVADVSVLEAARRELGLTVGELWLRYFHLGGMSTSLEVDAILNGALVATAANHDRLAVALNERFAEQGGDHPIPYCSDEAGPS